MIDATTLKPRPMAELSAEALAESAAIAEAIAARRRAAIEAGLAAPEPEPAAPAFIKLRTWTR